MVQVHQGSWFGLPDFGITEAVGGLLGRPQTAQGGSNIFAGGKASTPSTPTYPGTGPIGQGTPTPAPSQSTSSGSGGFTQQQALDTGQDWNKLLASGQAIIQNPQPVLDEIENSFRERMSRLDNIAGTLQGALPGQIQDVQGQYGAQVATADVGKREGERVIGEAEGTATENRTNAQSDARRLYNDLITGLGQRFGGLSTAGKFSSEIAAGELQRNFGNINQTFQAAQKNIGNMKMSLNDKYTSLVTQLQANRDSAINNLRQNLNNQLLQVESMKGEAEQAKSDRRLAALQDYRNQVFQVNSSIMNFKMQLDAEMKAGLSQIDEANNFFTQLGMSASQQAGTVPNQSDLSMNVGGAPTGASQQYMGQITPGRREDDVLSSARNSFSMIS